MLIGNYCVLNKSVGRRFGGNSTALASGIGSGSICGLPVNFGQTGAMRNFAWQDLSTDVLELHSVPAGYAGKGWLMPVTGGSMSSHSEAQGGSTASLTLAEGRNVAGASDGTSTAVATLQLVVSLSGTSAGTSTVTGNVGASLSAVGSAAGTGAASATIGALAWAYGVAAGTSTASLTRYATGRLYGSITPFTELSPESLASSVWAATAATNNEVGTMGEKLNSAGGAADPWDDSRALTVGKFLGLK